MSLATFGRSGGEGEVILPLIEYDELEREAAGEEAEMGAAARDGGGDKEAEDMAEEYSGEGGCGGVERAAWDPGPMANWGAEHGWGMRESDAPSWAWDSRRWTMSRPRVQTLVDEQLQFQ